MVNNVRREMTSSHLKMKEGKIQDVSCHVQLYWESLANAQHKYLTILSSNS
jgi:hypothetical protein